MSILKPHTPSLHQHHNLASLSPFPPESSFFVSLPLPPPPWGQIHSLSRLTPRQHSQQEGVLLLLTNATCQLDLRHFANQSGLRSTCPRHPHKNCQIPSSASRAPSAIFHHRPQQSQQSGRRVSATCQEIKNWGTRAGRNGFVGMQLGLRSTCPSTPTEMAKYLRLFSGTRPMGRYVHFFNRLR